MAKRAKARGGRVTPKKGAVATTSGRYTPPIPRKKKVSPIWVPALMFTCLLAGVALIVVNYLDVLPGGTQNLYLLIGLGLITVGFLTATQYR